MYRSHNCGELNASHINTEVTLAGWVQKSRDKGFMNWVDLRDRYGITQLIFDESRTDKAVFELAKTLGREFVIQVKGTVIEREAKNKNMSTGDIEILVTEMTVLNAALTPPFTIEDETDGGEDIRMKYRYLDIRRNPVKNSLLFRHKVAMEVRKYLSDLDFCEVETPYLIKSTPEGARDFVVPSRMNEGQFYALPQSPQTFKQLLMVGGMDKYFQIVKCFRDEDLRADRQPEFTQIDCEMAFVEQEDILNVFEGLTRHLLKEIKGIEVEKFPRITYDYAMKTYGNDKPDIRFGMEFGELNEIVFSKKEKNYENKKVFVYDIFYILHLRLISNTVIELSILDKLFNDLIIALKLSDYNSNKTYLLEDYNFILEDDMMPHLWSLKQNIFGNLFKILEYFNIGASINYRIESNSQDNDIFTGVTNSLIKFFLSKNYDEYYNLNEKTESNIDFADILADNILSLTKLNDFELFNSAELVVGIAVPGCATYTRKEIDNLIDWVKRPQVGASGMVYAKYEMDGSIKSSVDKFYDQEDLKKWAEVTGAKPGDLILVLSGPSNKTRAQLSALRMELATRLGLRNPEVFTPLWVVDFPLLEQDEENGRWHAMHHPFTSPKPEDMALLETDPGKVRANAYDMVLNGNEIGGGSIRIHDKATQQLMFKYLGFTEDEAKAQFGFLMDAFQFGAPPHGGLAFGLDRLVAILGGQETIRDFIAFPKNNSGRDVMIDAPSAIDDKQLEELHIRLK